MAIAKTEIKGLGEIKIYRRRGLKRVSLRVDNDGAIRLSLPWYVSKSNGLEFAYTKLNWLKRQKLKHISYPRANLQQLEVEAREYLPLRLSQLAKKNSFRYKKVRFSKATTRWASCSQKSTISLNIGLMALPRDLIDYVLVHELCHLKEMNHSKKFWALVRVHCPDYKEKRKLLRSYKPLMA